MLEVPTTLKTPGEKAARVFARLDRGGLREALDAIASERTVGLEAVTARSEATYMIKDTLVSLGGSAEWGNAPGIAAPAERGGLATIVARERWVVGGDSDS